MIIATYGELCGQILDNYRALLGDPVPRLDDPDFRTLLQSRTVVEKVKENDKLSTELFSPEEIFTFLQTLLDCFGISLASGSEDLSILDMALIGPKKDRIGDLRDDHIRDFLFSKLFQGWWHSRHKGSRIRDLSMDSGPRRARPPRCDYAIAAGDRNIELVECKRIHPHPFKNDSFPNVAEKIVDKAYHKAAVQFSSTENKLAQEGKRVFCRNLLLDISSYSSPSPKRVDNQFGVSGFATEEIDRVKELVLCGRVDGGPIDRITLCWSQVIYRGDLPIAIQQHVLPVLLNEQAEDIVDYQGWTVEAYPRAEDLRCIVETRVSTCARGLPWIRAGYHSQIDALLEYGREETYTNLENAS